MAYQSKDSKRNYVYKLLHLNFLPFCFQRERGESVSTTAQLNGRRPEYVRCLLKFLPISSSLHTLELQDNKMNDELAGCIADPKFFY